MTVINDPKLVVAPTALARPAYLAPVAEPGFGTKLTRIAGDTDGAIPSVGGLWWKDSRHGYSRRNPWNSDGSLFMLEQRGGTPSKLILNASSWAPIRGNAGNLRACTEVRWHPKDPRLMVGWNDSAGEIVVFDPLTDAVVRRVGPIPTYLGWMGEGSLSDDGSVVAMGDTSNHVLVVDILNGRVGPLVTIDFGRSDAHALGNLTVSSLSTTAGGRVVCKASSSPEYARVYEFAPDLTLTQGRLLDVTMSHADVGVTPQGGEVFVGGFRSWIGAAGAGPDTKDGRIIAVELDTGAWFNVSAGINQTGLKEAGDQHCSCRGPRGYVLTTYACLAETSGQYADELVLWRLDGSRGCTRFGVTRTNDNTPPAGVDPYRSEAHGCARPDGKAVVCASNWSGADAVPYLPGDIKDVVHELDGTITPPTPAGPRYIADPAFTYQPPGAVMDTSYHPPRLVPLPDVVKLLNGLKS